VLSPVPRATSIWRPDISMTKRSKTPKIWARTLSQSVACLSFTILLSEVFPLLEVKLLLLRHLCKTYVRLLFGMSWMCNLYKFGYVFTTHWSWSCQCVYIRGCFGLLSPRPHINNVTSASTTTTSTTNGDPILVLVMDVVLFALKLFMLISEF
jgi:hypothetical protein